MKRPSHLVILAMIFAFCSCSADKKPFTLTSPDGSIVVTIHNEESITYSIQKDSNQVLEKSSLGLSFENSADFDQLSWESISEQQEVQSYYNLIHGKRIKNNYLANQAILSLKGQNDHKVNIIFQLSNDGLAFQYEILGDTGKVYKIDNELTTFNFQDSARAWLQPMAVAKSGWNRTNPSYEENYFVDIPVGQATPTDAGWVYPALFKTENDWVMVTESGLGRNYCGTRLEQNAPNGEYKVGFPPMEEGIMDGPVNPESTLPWKTPWRVITIGPLETIAESNLGNALAAPPIDMDESVVKPGLASWSWALLKDESIKYDIQKEFIDYAADMGWSYCLVDVNWDTTIGYDKIEELSDYAQSKDVGLILWYNSAGDWNDVTYHPKDKFLTAESRAEEFSRLQEMGIKGIKVDFFGGDGQSVINYYHDIMTDAAEYGLHLNFHGATLPRGWHRTYPNLMTMESIKGFEFITFEQGNADLAPEHCAIIPFTRNAFDPMDFTPMSLTTIPNIERRSSPAFELALPVLFLSGIQHIAETPGGMEQVPDYVKNYLKDIPVAWDETQFIDGFPGKYVVLARRKGSTWHVVGINATDDVVENIYDLSFLESSSGTYISDGDDSGFSYMDVTLGSDEMKIKMEPKGGFVMKF